MLYYKVTVNGNTYEVGVEEMGGSPEVKTIQTVHPTQMTAPAPQAKSSAQPAMPNVDLTPVAITADAQEVTAPLPGTVISINVSVGDKVKVGQVLIIFEAMKMENELVASKDGTIAKIHVSKGEMLESGKAVVTIV